MKKEIPSTGYQTAIFAMGCFWCAEDEYRDGKTLEPIAGVIDIKSGYAGGTIENPSYENHPGYKEAIKIIFDPAVISYGKLLEIFWRNVDPFDATGQFCDKGFSYTSAIFYMDENQKNQALESMRATEKTLAENQKIATEILPYTTFYDAEDYHQNFKKKSPIRYNYYRWNCGRDERLDELWKNKDQ